MSANQITCELVGQRDLDTRYLAGQLPADEAEAFEAHYFGCDHCWALVRQGQEVRSALLNAPSVGAASAGRPATPRRRGAWWALAAAAAIAGVAISLWQFSAPGSGRDGTRGGGDSIPLYPDLEGRRATVAWPRVPEADVYRVRLQAADGTVLLERELSDTTLRIAVDSLRRPTRPDSAFWYVEALDRLGRPVARSSLIRAVPPPGPP